MLVRLRDLGQERFWNRRGMSRFLDKVDVMDVACRMELRHEEGVHVPELGFNERAPHFLKSHAHEFGLHGIEKLAIRMSFARCNARCAKTDRVLAETLRPPAPVFQQFGGELGDFSCSPM